MSLRSEDTFLSLIDEYFPNIHAHMPLGRGDDCAVLRAPDWMCLTADMFVEDVHFRRSYFSAEDIGYKALAVNLSDIAGMGARPLGFALNLMATGRESEAFCEGLIAGMADLAREHDLPLVGGDLSRGPVLGVAITMWGKSQKRFLLRRNCQAGDWLFCLGELGLARCGLAALESGEDDLVQRFPRAVQAHLRPHIRLEQAQALGDSEEIRGLMDVSDGLMQDLPRFLGPELGLEVELRESEIHPEVVDFAREQAKIPPVEQTLLGGEDYALLGAVPPESQAYVARNFPDSVWLGQVVQRPGIFTHGTRLDLQGFDHFGAAAEENE